MKCPRCYSSELGINHCNGNNKDCNLTGCHNSFYCMRCDHQGVFICKQDGHKTETFRRAS